MVKIINKMDEITKDKKVVIDFFATWCKPCQRIAPDYQKLSETYTDIEFYKCDIDESAELSELFEVQLLPTFLFINDLKVITKMEGADLEELTKNVETLNNLTTSTIKKCISKSCCDCTCIEECTKECNN